MTVTVSMVTIIEKRFKTLHSMIKYSDNPMSEEHIAMLDVLEAELCSTAEEGGTTEMLTAFEHGFEQGELSGYQHGYSRGDGEGYVDGHKDGMTESVEGYK